MTLDLAPPLGAHVDERGTTFAVAAAHATSVELCLFDGPGDAGAPEGEGGEVVLRSFFAELLEKLLS
mgnify:CR=1 FL=1